MSASAAKYARLSRELKRMQRFRRTATALWRKQALRITSVVDLATSQAHNERMIALDKRSRELMHGILCIKADMRRLRMLGL